MWMGPYQKQGFTWDANSAGGARTNAAGNAWGNASKVCELIHHPVVLAFDVWRGGDAGDFRFHGGRGDTDSEHLDARRLRWLSIGNCVLWVNVGSTISDDDGDVLRVRPVATTGCKLFVVHFVDAIRGVGVGAEVRHALHGTLDFRLGSVGVQVEDILGIIGVVDETDTDAVVADGESIDEQVDEVDDDVPVIIAVVSGVVVSDGTRAVHDEDDVEHAIRTSCNSKIYLNPCAEFQETEVYTWFCMISKCSN